VYPFPELSATATDSDGNTSEFSLKTPVIFVPGIAGSTLVNRAQLLFDEFWLGIPQALGCNFAPPPFDCNTFRARLSLRPQDVAGTEIAAGCDSPGIHLTSLRAIS
jgi:hypothetical protein